MSDLKKIIDDTAYLMQQISEVNVSFTEYSDYLKNKSPEIPYDIARCLFWYGGAVGAKEVGYSLDKEAKKLCQTAVEILQKRLTELARQLEKNAVTIRVMTEGDLW